jgi:hypothetical protein
METVTQRERERDTDRDADKMEGRADMKEKERNTDNRGEETYLRSGGRGLSGITNKFYPLAVSRAACCWRKFLCDH